MSINKERVTPTATPRPASTVVLARDAADGGVEILLVQRAPELRFMGGMYVFPGGAVHASDAEDAVVSRVAVSARAWPPDPDLPIEGNVERSDREGLGAASEAISRLEPSSERARATEAGRTDRSSQTDAAAASSNSASSSDAPVAQLTGQALEQIARRPAAAAAKSPAHASRESFAEALARGEPAVVDRAYALAAIRETCEEVALLLGVDDWDSAKLERARRMLAGSMGPPPPSPSARAASPNPRSATTTLLQVLDAVDAQIDLSVVVPLSRWVTPAGSPIRFDTRFYVARAPSTQDACADGTESCSIVWLSPSRALAAHRAGSIVLSPPTRCTLEDLAELSSVNQLLARATTTCAAR